MKKLEQLLTMNSTLKAGSLLAIFTAICIFLVSLSYEGTIDMTKYNKQQFLIKQLNQLVNKYDNDILKSKKIVNVELYNSKQNIVIYYAKRNNKTFARLIKHTYPAGYNGNIELLSAIDNNNKIIGVRVISHQETPGLGDKIELQKSNWILSFKGASLDNIWKVTKQGGDFDSWTGATITPQAVITAVHELLKLLTTKQFK